MESRWQSQIATCTLMKNCQLLLASWECLGECRCIFHLPALHHTTQLASLPALSCRCTCMRYAQYVYALFLVVMPSFASVTPISVLCLWLPSLPYFLSLLCLYCLLCLTINVMATQLHAYTNCYVSFISYVYLVCYAISMCLTSLIGLASL